MGFLKSLYKFLVFFMLLCIQVGVAAQQNVHPQSGTYEWPTDPQVKEKLDKWQDQKFGLILHWGCMPCRA